ncbi:MAG TPA: hypothetical protein VG936_18050 [Lacunisphaera sp.]|nr:hypothetical protein [Lacunisphaera sp.]
MLPREYAPGRRTLGAAILVVAATYAYFLLFAQFAFLRQVSAVAGGSRAVVGPIMTVMGVAGIAGSWLAARVYRIERSRRILASGLAVGGAAALLSLVATVPAVLYVVSALVGLGAGVATVTLACVLRPAVGSERLGTAVGLGTGLAYGFCNLPMVFAAGTSGQALIAALVALGGSLAVRELTLDGPREAPLGYDYSRAGLAGWTAVFLVLVAMDSMAFAIIQQTPALKERSWTGSGQLEMNALIHFIAAMLAGFALDHRWVGRTTLAGALLLLGALALPAEGEPALAPWGMFYAAGVSLYSTALVFYPARGSRPRVAALVYSVAGWGGSALGVVLAANRHELPGLQLAVAAGLVAVILADRKRRSRREMSAERPDDDAS